MTPGKSGTDISRMTISELISFANKQAQIELENPSEADPDRNASWRDTLELLQIMQERGVPEWLKD